MRREDRWTVERKPCLRVYRLSARPAESIVGVAPMLQLGRSDPSCPIAGELTPFALAFA
jgi:hypothetical protein